MYFVCTPISVVEIALLVKSAQRIATSDRKKSNRRVFNNLLATIIVQRLSSKEIMNRSLRIIGPQMDQTLVSSVLGPQVQRPHEYDLKSLQSMFPACFRWQWTVQQSRQNCAPPPTLPQLLWALFHDHHQMYGSSFHFSLWKWHCSGHQYYQVYLLQYMMILLVVWALW